MRTNATMAVLAAATMLMAGSIGESIAAPSPRYLGATTGEPEKDSFGYLSADLVQNPHAAVLLSAEAQYLGLRMGGEEQDTFARTEVLPKISAGLTR
jgi:hypothetical protein